MSGRFGRCRLTVSFGIGVIWTLFPAGAQETGSEHHTRSEIRRLTHEAKTADQYDELARYFRSEEANFRHRADEENKAYERYHITTRPKVPTAADNARSSRDYYMLKADHAASLATKYEALRASTLRPATAGTVVSPR
jgi:hypothetical protein